MITPRPHDRFRWLRPADILLAAFALAVGAVAPCLAQQPGQDIQFAVRLPGESFDRFCPATAIPPIPATTGAAVSFSSAVLAAGAVDVQVAARRPDGQPATLAELDAILAPPPPFSVTPGDGTEVVFFWIPVNVEPGLYQLDLSASDPITGRFSTCSIPIALERGCNLLGAVDLDDGDEAIDFGAVTIGGRRTATIGAILNPDLFSGSDPVGFCPIPDASFQIGQGADPDTLTVTFEPAVAGEAAAAAVVFHPSDVTSDPCAAGAADSNSCIRQVALRGTANPARVAAQFSGVRCGRTSTVEMTLENRLSAPLNGLAASVSAPAALVPLGSFSGTDFTLGPAGSSQPPSSRQFRVELPAEAAGLPVTVAVGQGAASLLEVPLPDLGCPFVVPETIDFGDVEVGLSGSAFVAVDNPAESAIAIRAAIEPAGSGFSIEPEEATVQPGGTGILEVRFAPVAGGPSAAEVAITSFDPVTDFRIPLIAVGLGGPAAELTLALAGQPIASGAEAQLPAVRVGERSSAVLRMSNPGAGPLRNVRLTIPDGDFSVSPAAIDAIPPAEAVEATIVFEPTGPGAAEARLEISADGVAGAVLRLTSEASVAPIGLSLSAPGSVAPGQFDPFPTLQLALAEAAAERLSGEIDIGWRPSNALAIDPGLRFVNTGQRIAFEIPTGGRQAVFASEPDTARARFQVGTVAGWIDFTLTELRNGAGERLPFEPAAGLTSVLVETAPPAIAAISGCESVGAGVVLSIRAFSPSREVNGVELRLQPAPGAELRFTPPDEGFANQAFAGWFGSVESLAYGGAFRLVIPVNLDNRAAYGGAEIRIRNALGWSPMMRLPADSCR